MPYLPIAALVWEICSEQCSNITASALQDSMHCIATTFRSSFLGIHPATLGPALFHHRQLLVVPVQWSLPIKFLPALKWLRVTD